MTPTPEQLAKAMDLGAIKAKLDGGAWTTCCRHPDIERFGYWPTSKQRQCVLDDGAPESCQMSDPRNPNRVTDKTACEFWKPLQWPAAARISIAEARALLSALEAKDAALRRIRDAQPSDWPREHDDDTDRVHYYRNRFWKLQAIAAAALGDPTRPEDGR